VTGIEASSRAHRETVFELTWNIVATSAVVRKVTREL
jgi:hypothetical protein